MSYVNLPTPKVITLHKQYEPVDTQGPAWQNISLCLVEESQKWRRVIRTFDVTICCFPTSTATQNSMDSQKSAQEHYGDITFCILESFPFQEDKALGSFPSMMSVCPLASSIEPVDRVS